MHLDQMRSLLADSWSSMQAQVEEYVAIMDKLAAVSTRAARHLSMYSSLDQALANARPGRHGSAAPCPGAGAHGGSGQPSLCAGGVWSLGPPRASSLPYLLAPLGS
jgi:hypothetical protein